MANYFARVELHDAEWPDDYEDLHEYLKKEGFSNCLPLSDGRKKRLPTGLYWARNRSDDKAVVYRKVKKCADDTGFDSEVIVIKSGGSQSGLSKDC
jgi:hypothetical protein